MVYSASTFGAVFSFIDSGGNVVIREFDMDPDIVLFDDANDAAVEMLADVIAMTDAVIVSYRVFQNNWIIGLVLPAVGIQVENQASMTVQLASPGNKKANINIPSPKNTIFVSATPGPQNNVVNMGATIVTDFLANFLAAGKFTVSDGEEISRGLSGKRVHKKSSKG